MGRPKLYRSAEWIKAYKAEYFQRNKASLMAKDKKWAAENKERSREIKRNWELKNPNQKKEYRKKIKASNPEKLREYSRRWASLNKEKVKESSAKWYLKNPNYSNEYNRKNPNGYIMRSARRRALKLSNSTLEQILGAAAIIPILRSPKYSVCPYCGDLFLTSRMDLEHILALASGGPHEAKNLIMACSPCNAAKADKLLWIEWTPPVEFYGS